MDLKLEEARGEEASRILQNPMYVEAWDAVRSRIIDRLELASIDKAERDKLNDLLVAHKKVRQYMEQVLQTGTMAAIEIDRQATLAERMGDRLRKVF